MRTFNRPTTRKWELVKVAKMSIEKIQIVNFYQIETVIKKDNKPFQVDFVLQYI